jgi:hypothetical protein
MRIRRVDHVEVAPVEGAVWWRERKLRMLALCVDVSTGMAVASVEPAVGAGDGEPNEREQGKEHERRTAGVQLIWLLLITSPLARLRGAASGRIIMTRTLIKRRSDKHRLPPSRAVMLSHYAHPMIAVGRRYFRSPRLPVDLSKLGFGH